MHLIASILVFVNTKCFDFVLVWKKKYNILSENNTKEKNGIIKFI